MNGSDTVGAGNDGNGGQAEKETMLDDARNGVKGIRKRSCIGNAAKRCIDNEMSTVGYEGLAAGLAQHQRTGKAELFRCLCDGDFGGSETKRIDLDRQWEAAERLDQLGLVGDHDHARRGRRDDLLAQQRTAAALDQRKCWIDLVGTVDGKVELGCLFQRRQRNRQLAAKRGGPFRRRHADDLHAGRNLFGQQADEFLGGGTCTDAQAHTALDITECGPCRLDLQSLGIHDLFANSQITGLAPSIFADWVKGFMDRGLRRLGAKAIAFGEI